MYSMGLNSISKFIPPLILVLFLIDIGFCVAYFINYIIGQPSYKLTVVLDLNSEKSLGTWYSSTQYFCLFILSAIFSYHKFSKNSKSFSLLIFPIMFLFMSIDESIQIHEWIGYKSDIFLPGGSREGTFFHKTGIWMFVVGLPFIVLFLLLAYSLKNHFSENTSRLKKLVIGMVVMLTGALGIEIISNFAEFGPLVIVVAFEEGLEMIGATTMLWALYDVTKDYLPSMNWKDG